MAAVWPAGAVVGGEVWRREGVGVRVGYIDGLVVRCIRSIRSRFRERVLRGRVEPGEETRRLPHCVGGRKRGQAAKNNMADENENCDNKRREREECEVIGAAGGGQVARPGFGRREPSVSIPILFSAPPRSLTFALAAAWSLVGVRFWCGRRVFGRGFEDRLRARLPRS